MGNKIRVTVVEDRVQLEPEEAFTKAAFTPTQATDLIEALQDAIASMRPKDLFERNISMNNWWKA